MARSRSHKSLGAAGEAARRRAAASRRPAPVEGPDLDGWTRALLDANPDITVGRALAMRRGEYVLARERAHTPVNAADRPPLERLRRVGLDLERVRAREAVLWERAAPLVAELRAEGLSWRHVGQALGISDVAARKRFR